MSGPRADDAGRWCRSAAARLSPDADADAVRTALADAPVVTGRLWIEEVTAAHGSPEGAARLGRELSRPVDPATGTATRSVILRYPDGSRDLVVVSHHAPDPPPARAPAPGWGLGDGDGRRAMAADPLDMTGLGLAGLGLAGLGLAGRGLAGLGLAGLVAALGIVVGRYSGSDRVRVGLHPGRVLSLAAGPDLTVGDYLTSVGTALDGTTPDGTTPDGPDDGDPPVAGLAVAGLAGWSPAVDVVQVRPFLVPPYPLSVALAGSAATLWYWPGEVATEVAAGFARRLAQVARCLAGLAGRTPDRRLAEVEMLDEDEQRAVAELGGLGRGLVQPTRLIHRVVEARAAEAPDAVAVSLGAGRLTYRELDERAGQVARSLRARAVPAGARVGVRLERSLEFVTVLLGVLKAGAAYVPMDPAWPAERVAFVARDAALALLVSSSDAVGGVPSVPPEALAGDAAADGEGDGEAPADAVEVTPADAAYVIYTSGSTGRPKGVAIAHGNVTRLLDATADDFGLGPRDVWTQFHSAAFDFSVWEIWGCLMTGGRLVVVPYRTSRAPDAFAALLAAEEVTVLAQTPSAFAQLLAADREAPQPRSLRLVVFGGEPLDTAPLAAWFDRYPERSCRLVNMYGITETTVHVTAQTVGRAEALSGSRSVGRPLTGWHVYVMDRDGRLVPPGVAGEIYVGGVGVAAGYLNRPELTAERFVPDPYAEGLLYRTGDLGRLRPDGRLDHLGRLDRQVQLRGHRVELGEVRARLLDTPGVRAAAVVPRHDPADPVAARLDAYVVGDAEPHDVRRHAEAFLPDYMVPATITRLPALPLTANGKVDEVRLPEPSAAPDLAKPSGGSLAGTVHAAWEQVFGFRVGPDDDSSPSAAIR